MKIHILSDLHNEFTRFVPPETDADLVVLAGDIDIGTAGVRWATSVFKKPVIYVAGNHEFYRGDLDADRLAMQKCAAGSHLHLLECGAVVVDGVRFIGTTLWTDFRVGATHDGDVDTSMATAQNDMNDFRLIRHRGRQFTPADSVRLFETSAEFLAKALAEPFAGTTVVVTHHAPSPKSIHPRYEGDPINGSFSSDLEHLMQGRHAPALWIHGHTHDSFDYLVHGNTRVVANPRGYTSPNLIEGQENPAFDPALVVEVPGGRS